jgi:hypothetical protein
MASVTDGSGEVMNRGYWRLAALVFRRYRLYRGKPAPIMEKLVMVRSGLAAHARPFLVAVLVMDAAGD